ncbi:hypothetical protein LCGC14_2001360 [marine sediment metagenome]|uniref:Uncharacterized protein n=1 Tax=marine sediment metagenome TaxID=412755 RepID=A0A0F9F3E5_9ZZZZ
MSTRTYNIQISLDHPFIHTDRELFFGDISDLIEGVIRDSCKNLNPSNLAHNLQAKVHQVEDITHEVSGDNLIPFKRL